MKKTFLCTLLVVILVGANSHAADNKSGARTQSRTPGWLGFGFELRHDSQKAVKTWLYVRKLVAGGPAEKAGLRLQDVIIKINGKPIGFTSDTAALDFFASRTAGEKILLNIVRASGPLQIAVIAGKRPVESDAVWKDNYERAAEQDAAQKSKAGSARKPGQN
jgi:C-terminal processing protease CtpA/Prc